LGIPVKLCRYRQCPVYAIGSIGSVDCCLGLGEVVELSSEPQSVDSCPGGGEIITLNLALEPQPIERPLGIYAG
jgi:hypothetical protein